MWQTHVPFRLVSRLIYHLLFSKIKSMILKIKKKIQNATSLGFSIEFYRLLPLHSKLQKPQILFSSSFERDFPLHWILSPFESQSKALIFENPKSKLRVRKWERWNLRFVVVGNQNWWWWGRHGLTRFLLY